MLILILQIICQVPENLSDYIKRISEELKQRRDFLESEWKTRCSKTTCKESYLTCSDYTPILSCSERFNVTACECSSPRGSLVRKEESSVHISNRPLSPSQSITETVCAISSIDTYFNRAFEAFPDVSWQYVGTYNGIHRTFPGHEIPCSYDPRFRPWYVAGASGAKNLIIILDTSGSMEDISKLKVAKEALQTVIDTLTINDWIGLVTFNTLAIKRTSRLIRATIENKNLINSIINDLIAEGSTNYEDAFVKAYDLVRLSRADELGPVSCQTIFLFLTDGVPTIGIKEIDKLVALIESIEANDKINAIFMAYAFGLDAEPKQLVPITCARGGITQYVNDNSELKEKLQNYYVMLSRGITRNEVIWTEPYLDLSGLGTKTSAVLPFYDRTVNPPFLLGVLSMDMAMEDLRKFTSTEVLLKGLVSTGCTKINLTQCQLEEIRPSEYRCGNQGCTADVTNISVCSNGFNLNGFKGWGPLNLNVPQFTCCGNNSCNLLSIIIPIVVVLIAIISIIICCCICKIRKKIKEQNKRKEKEDSMKTVAREKIEEKNILENNYKNDIDIKMAPLEADKNINK